MRLGETIEATKSPFGTISYFTFDKPIGEALRLYGEWAMAEIRFATQFIAPGSVVLDGGANVGMHTLAFAEACGSTGKVIAVEASPEIAAVLGETIAANELRQVELVSAALGETVGRCRIGRLNPDTLQNAGMLHTDTERSLGDECDAFEVDCVSIDSLNIAELSLIKLDIEGAEAAAIRGGIATISRLRPAILVETLNLTNSLPVFETLTGLGYAAFFCSFAAYDENNFYGEHRNIFGCAREASMLFVPDAATAPEPTDGARVMPIRNPDDLARALMEMPRYGDRTEHDRVIDALVQERDGLQQELERLRPAPTLDPPEWIERESFAREIQHVWHSLSTALEAQQALRERIDEAEGALGSIGDKADGVRVDALHRELLTLVEELRTKPDAARVAELHKQLARLAASIDGKMDRADATRSINELAGHLDAVDARVAQANVEAAAAQGQIPAMSAALTRQIREVADGVDDTIARLKSELTSIREALLGRNEDRGRQALAMERLDERVQTAGREVATTIDALSRSVDARLAAMTDDLRRDREAAARSAGAVSALLERFAAAERTMDAGLASVGDRLDRCERRHDEDAVERSHLAERLDRLTADLARHTAKPDRLWLRLTGQFRQRDRSGADRHGL